ncbi:unnamed protein product [Fraxinus pennsylvanica]|uniref:Cytochrome P450 n=1 Tax=Fraxinus pennsylvanica TaxID=56036 RepID=A0AAD1Z301_9LAMI|nr:unnamed protein product [Fraxinus pennsylvanica]
MNAGSEFSNERKSIFISSATLLPPFVGSQLSVHFPADLHHSPSLSLSPSATLLPPFTSSSSSPYFSLPLWRTLCSIQPSAQIWSGDLLFLLWVWCMLILCCRFGVVSVELCCWVRARGCGVVVVARGSALRIVDLKLQQSGELSIPITNDNIKAIIFDLFSAGTETSSATIDWAIAELMRNQDVMAKTQAEIRQCNLERIKQLRKRKNLELCFFFWDEGTSHPSLVKNKDSTINLDDMSKYKDTPKQRGMSERDVATFSQCHSTRRLDISICTSLHPIYCV